MIKQAISKYLKRTNHKCLDLKAILFDMDGILFDSMPFHTQSWYDTISGRNIPCTQDEFYLFEGRTGASTINELYLRTYNREATEVEKLEIYAEKSDRFNQCNKHIPMKGADLVLEKVNAAGLATLVVTGSGQRSLIDRLNSAYPNQFDPCKTISAVDVKHGKPHPEPYLMGLERADVYANQAIVIENAPLGVQAGNAAGVFTIAVNTGPISNNILLEAGADLLFPDMASLASHWQEIMNECHKA